MAHLERSAEERFYHAPPDHRICRWHWHLGVDQRRSRTVEEPKRLRLVLRQSFHRSDCYITPSASRKEGPTARSGGKEGLQPSGFSQAMKKEPIQPPQTTTGSSAPSRVFKS